MFLKFHQIIFLFMLGTFSAEGQNCQCLTERLNLECDTSFLKSNALLYYQYNCDSVWLTMENVRGEKYILYQLETELFNGPKLAFLKGDCERSILISRKELEKDVQYYLIDKSTGRMMKSFQNVIDQSFNRTPLIAYFHSEQQRFFVYNMDTGLEVELSMPEDVLPYRNKCLGSSVDGDFLTLYFYIGNDETKKIEWDISKTLLNEN